MSRWFRLYDDTLNDPKILKLSDRLHRLWIGLLCAASKNDGRIPPLDDLALLVRMSVQKLRPLLESLIKSGLIDDDGAVLRPHNWDGRQYKSDISTDRVKRFRERSKTVSVTPPDTDTDTDTDTDKKERIPADAGDDEKASRETFQPVQTESPSGLTTKYHFESGIIKLRERDFFSWEKAFSYLDLRAELIALTPWADREGSNWFHAVSGALAKRNREQKNKVSAAKEHPHKWRSGIEGVV